MVYIIFTKQGLSDALADIAQAKAEIWTNSGIVDTSKSQQLQQQDISVHQLPEDADPENEKSVIKALKYVEGQTSDKEIYVEYL
jgi:hypothetical protein